MKAMDLLLSCLSITEDEYNYSGSFTLSTNEKSKNIDIIDLENKLILTEIKTFFNLEEDIIIIRRIIMDMLVEKACIGSLIVEGEDFDERCKSK